MSVPNLITDLCNYLLKSLVNTNNLREPEVKDIVTRLGTKCFQLLLKENCSKDKIFESSNNAETQLAIFQISLLLNHDQIRAKKIKESIEKLDLKKYENIIKLLLCLRDKNICNVEYKEEMRDYHTFETYKYIQDYPTFLNDDFRLPEVVEDYNIYSKVSESLTYIDSNLMQLKSIDEIEMIESDYAMNIEDNRFSSMPHFFIPKLTTNRNLEIIPKTSSIWDLLSNSDELVIQRPQEGSERKMYELLELKHEMIYIVWDMFCQSKLLPKKVKSGCVNDVHVLQPREFLKDATNLLVGISSSTFSWSEDDQMFVMKENITVNGIIPNTFKQFCNDLIMAGTLYKRLHNLHIRFNQQLKHGYVFKDLCLKIFDFLKFYRTLVLSNENKSLLYFKAHVRKCTAMIESVARCFFVDTVNKDVLRGINFLNHIYQEFLCVSITDYAHIVYYFLVHCYCIYFRRFIKPWICEGILVDPFDEFFIVKNDYFTQFRNRKYWTNGFRISENVTIPSFIDEYKEQILLCGKSACFISHCLQNFRMPMLSTNDLNKAFLSEKQLEKLSVAYEDNQQMQILQSEPTVSVKYLYDVENKIADDLKERASKEYMSTLLRIKAEMNRQREVNFEKKKKRFEEYYEERKTQQLIKDLIVSQELRNELIKFGVEKVLDEQKQNMIAVEKQAIQKYYANLTDNLNLEHQLMNKRVEILQTLLNKNLLSLPLTTTPLKIDNITTSNVTVMNITTPTNQNQMELVVNDFTTTKALISCDNVTTPINNNQNFITTETNAELLPFIEESSENSTQTQLENIENQVVRNVENQVKENLVDLNEIESLDIDEETNKNNQIESISKTNPYLNSYSTVFSTKSIFALEFDDSDANNTPSIENNFQNLFDIHCNLQCSDLDRESCKFFDLRAGQSLAVPLNNQLNLISNYLMRYFLVNLEILNHFRTLSNYFFFFHSEYKQNLTRKLFNLLYNVDYPKEIFNFKMLHEIILFALTTNSVPAKFKDNISLQLLEVPAVLNLQSADLLNCLSLTYHVDWPLNIIISDKILNKYNKIFQYLLKLRRVQWVLNDIYSILKFAQKEMNFEKSSFLTSLHYKNIHLMRHIMNTCLTSMLCHVTEVVLHSSWFEFEKDLLKVKTVDDIYQTHKRFIDDAVFSCSLNENSEPYIKYLNQTFELIFQFHELLRNRQFQSNGELYVHPNYYKLQLCFENFKEVTKYVMKLCEKQVRKGYQPHLVQFITVVNFNNYFD